MRKKILSMLLSVGVLASAFQVNVFAASFTVKTENSNYSYDFQKDETFDVAFVLENNTGIHSCNIKVHYDPKVIQAVDSTGNSGLDGYYTYFDDNNNETRFLSESYVNSAAKEILSTDLNGVSLPDGTADGKKTASELGYVIVADYSRDVVPMTGDKKLFTMRFKMVGSGSTNIEILPLEASGGNHYFTAFLGADNLVQNVVSIPGKVTLNASSSSSKTTTETTTQTATTKQTTTKSSSSSGGGGSSGSKQTTTQTTTETAAQATTEAPTENTTQQPQDDTSDIVFDDIEAYPWAKNAIYSLASKSIVSGIGNNKFNPAANVKRADFLLMLVKALELDSEFTDNFDDVPESKYYYNAVGVAKALGIANGQGDNKYNPEGFITRQDMMVLAKRAVEIKYEMEDADLSVLDKFTDKDDISDYAKDSLASMVNAGIVNGMGDNVAPKANTTRAQAAVIIYNVLDKLTV